MWYIFTISGHAAVMLYGSETYSKLHVHLDREISDGKFLCDFDMARHETFATRTGEPSLRTLEKALTTEGCTKHVHLHGTRNAFLAEKADVILLFNWDSPQRPPRSAIWHKANRCIRFHTCLLKNPPNFGNRSLIELQ